MCLNAMSIDTGLIWRWPWRWTQEEVLLRCLQRVPVHSSGLTLSQFATLARCHGLLVDVYLADASDIHAFRAAIQCTARMSSVVAEGHASDSCAPVRRGPEHAPLSASDAEAYPTFQEHNTNNHLPNHGDLSTDDDNFENQDGRGGLRECIAVSYSRYGNEEDAKNPIFQSSLVSHSPNSFVLTLL